MGKDSDDPDGFRATAFVNGGNWLFDDFVLIGVPDVDTLAMHDDLLVSAANTVVWATSTSPGAAGPNHLSATQPAKSSQPARWTRHLNHIILAVLVIVAAMFHPGKVIHYRIAPRADEATAKGVKYAGSI